MKARNIITALETALGMSYILDSAEHKKLIEALLEKLKEFQSANKPFALILQPGAGAPVAGFLSEWMEANLGGCTGELESCALSDRKDGEMIIINTMSQAEQEGASERVKIAAQNITIINDPDQVLKTVFAMDDAELKTVHDRTVYIPQAVICDAEALVCEIIKPEENAGKARDAKPYLVAVQRALSSLKRVAEENLPFAFGVTSEVAMFGGVVQEKRKEGNSSAAISPATTYSKVGP